MDMRKYAGSPFIKFKDVHDKTMMATIASVVDGKFDRPVLQFTSGEQLSLNATNVKALVRAYGDDSRDWVGCEIELYAGQTDYQNEKKDSVLVRPVSLSLAGADPQSKPKEPEPPSGPPWQPPSDEDIPF